MATRNATRSNGTGNPKQTTPRHLWLAALGLAAVTRRRLRTTFDGIDGEAGRLRRDALRFAQDAGAVARGAAITLQETVAARLDLRVSRLKAGVETRLRPLLHAFEPKPTARRPARKTRKPVAKKAKGRSAGARRKAATRVARKGRG